MRDVTPKAHRCTLGACPAILEVTPQNMWCVFGASCPSLFEVTPEALECDGDGKGKGNCPAIYEQQDGHIIIGKIMGFSPQTADREAMLSGVPEEIRPRIGPDEFAVWVPRGLVKPGDDNGRGPVPETIAPAAKIQGQPDETSG